MVIRVKQGLSLLCSSHRVYREAGYRFQFEPESEPERACFHSKVAGGRYRCECFHGRSLDTRSIAFQSASLHTTAQRNQNH